MVVPAVALAVGGTLVSACGQMESAAGMAAMPEVMGEPGAKPQVKPPRSAPGGGPRVRVLDRGSGAPTRPGQVVVANVDMRIWQGDKPYLSTWDTRQPTTVVLDGQHVGKTWERSLLGRRPGARVMLVSPAPQAFGPLGQAPSRVSPSDSLIEVFDVIGGYAPDAQANGVPVASTGGGLPEVTVPGGREPRIAVPSGHAPAALTTRTLVAGSGPAVRPGSTVVTNFVAATWDKARVYDSSYRRGGPNGFVMAKGAVPPGWLQGLTGVRAGSRVLMVVPERDGRGFTMTPGGVGAPPGHSIVYVFDILDVR
ncbi:FKBP-type peptidyl-prolyl cis-trans isomerase [Actinomadura barringtoniae]|uniref:Peptidyl-prolyl cis-trans isomerase n=1 Tax=Actinomadura barringtoniae TaxID=1427535 RepID=A0A939PG96_9ACTN|nr:FKBP-type peptidyl-prolyl cis-trans isomerase [Actinomadura barringtoniae]MBO2451970.1 FKBP-type peptidyl-prolyl cis-trans isomerase [Actinomadura barringtoniae]